MIITILRKSLDGSIADNTLKHGCGALNIDETRIGTEARTYKGSGKSEMVYSENRAGMSDGRGKEMEFKVEGRWPANFILIHKESCELKGTKKVKSNGHWTQKANIGEFYEGGWSHQEVDEGNKMSDEDGKEEVANWLCVEDCPVKGLDRQSGNRKTTWVSTSHKNNRQGEFLGALGHPKNQGYNDDGGASRFFKQFKKEEPNEP
tara:strand:+ start:31 stop:645 length:615 start_codon:yes stop_codon:yes gene_type:complete